MMNKPNMTLGENLLFARRRKGLSRTQLANIIGVSPSTISNYENNVSLPDIAKASKLADALGIKLDLIMMQPEAAEQSGIMHTPILSQNQTENMF